MQLLLENTIIPYQSFHDVHLIHLLSTCMIMYHPTPHFRPTQIPLLAQDDGSFGAFHITHCQHLLRHPSRLRPQLQVNLKKDSNLILKHCFRIMSHVSEHNTCTTNDYPLIVVKM
jgi:hypothetical protein